MRQVVLGFKYMHACMKNPWLCKDLEYGRLGDYWKENEHQ